MNFFTIATAISIIALGFVAVPRIRRALVLRKAGVPQLPKRAFPPKLPQVDDDDGEFLREMGRRRLYEAMGVEDEFGRPGRWP